MHLYIALYCVWLYTQSALQSYEGVSLQPPPVCSIHLDDATAATAQRRQCAHHTPATGGEERDRANQVDGDYWEAMIDKGQWREFGQDTGVTPLLFTMSVMLFLMTRECSFDSIVSPSLDHRVSTPCWPH